MDRITRSVCRRIKPLVRSRSVSTTGSEKQKNDKSSERFTIQQVVIDSSSFPTLHATFAPVKPSIKKEGKQVEKEVVQDERRTYGPRARFRKSSTQNSNSISSTAFTLNKVYARDASVIDLGDLKKSEDYEATSTVNVPAGMTTLAEIDGIRGAEECQIDTEDLLSQIETKESDTRIKFTNLQNACTYTIRRRPEGLISIEVPGEVPRFPAMVFPDHITSEPKYWNMRSWKAVPDLQFGDMKERLNKRQRYSTDMNRALLDSYTLLPLVWAVTAQNNSSIDLLDYEIITDGSVLSDMLQFFIKTRNKDFSSSNSQFVCHCTSLDGRILLSNANIAHEEASYTGKLWRPGVVLLDSVKKQNDDEIWRKDPPIGSFTVNSLVLHKNLRVLVRNQVDGAVKKVSEAIAKASRDHAANGIPDMTPVGSLGFEYRSAQHELVKTGFLRSIRSLIGYSVKVYQVHSSDEDMSAPDLYPEFTNIDSKNLQLASELLFSRVANVGFLATSPSSQKAQARLMRFNIDRLTNNFTRLFIPELQALSALLKRLLELPRGQYIVETDSAGNIKVSLKNHGEIDILPLEFYQLFTSRSPAPFREVDKQDKIDSAADN
ncbi:uncharacterized protein V2V93DRAFT_376182 [Kockiozyma suomiensis]|uniref:uncharacterized protein n=1 Tax=Kockiozyma suomiensis TaxID=1337062 RepID=UPI00334319C1